jgi:parvulin-like peptidyl-prolyl isomerase
MRKYIFLCIIICLFTANIYAGDADTIFGTFDDGKARVSMEEINLYKRTFMAGRSLLAEYVYMFKQSPEDRDCFLRLVAEKKLAESAEAREIEKLPDTREKLKIVKKEFLTIEFERSLIKKSRDITEQDIKEYFEKNAQDYKTGDRIKIRMIFKEFGLKTNKEKKDKARKAAEELREKVVDNPDIFGEIAEKYSDSETAKRKGEVGWLNRGMKVLNEEFFNRIYEMKEGEISDLVEMPSGYAIVQLHLKEKSAILPLREVKQTVKTSLIRHRIARIREELPEDEDELMKLKENLFEEKNIRKKWQYMVNCFYARTIIEERLRKIKIDEKDLKRYYHQKSKFFTSPREWELATIKISLDDKKLKKDRIRRHYEIKDAEIKAAEIRKRIENGEDFMTIAKNLPQNENNGYYGWVSSKTNSSFATKLHEKHVGDLIGPVGYSGGWWVLKVLRIKEPKLQSIEEVREKLLKWYTMSQNHRKRQFYLRNEYENAHPKIMFIE